MVGQGKYSHGVTLYSAMLDKSRSLVVKVMIELFLDSHLVGKSRTEQGRAGQAFRIHKSLRAARLIPCARACRLSCVATRSLVGCNLCPVIALTTCSAAAAGSIDMDASGLFLCRRGSGHRYVQRGQRGIACNCSWNFTVLRVIIGHA